MLRILVVVCFLSAFCYGLVVAIHTPVNGQEASSIKSKLQTLQEERRDVLKERAESCKVLALNARGDWSDAYSAFDDYFSAELELASNKEQRMEFLRQKVKNAVANEANAKAMETTARIGHAVVLQATAQRLKAEITLLREDE